MATELCISQWKLTSETTFAILDGNGLRTAKYIANQLQYDVIMVVCYRSKVYHEWDQIVPICTYQVRVLNDWTQLLDKLQRVYRRRRILLIVAGNHPHDMSDAILQACNRSDFHIIIRDAEVAPENSTVYLPNYLTPRAGLSFLFPSAWERDVFPLLRTYGLCEPSIRWWIIFKQDCMRCMRDFYIVWASDHSVKPTYLSQTASTLELPRGLREYMHSVEVSRTRIKAMHG
jgi:hypothetical protein